MALWGGCLFRSAPYTCYDAPPIRALQTGNLKGFQFKPAQSSLEEQNQWSLFAVGKFTMGAETGGYQVILWCQSVHNEILDWFALFATFLGTETFFLFFVPFFYWCVDKKHGIRLALVFLFSVYLNGFFKEFFQIPRPDPSRVRVLWASSGGGYSFPSGHAQNAMVFWGWLGRRPPWRTKPVLLGLVVLAISLSRIYMGLHFPVDIVGGWLLGGLLLVGLVAVDRRISRTPKGWEGRVLPWLGVILPTAVLLTQSRPLESMVAGAMTGFCSGYLLESRWVDFSPRGPWGYQALKLLLGWGGGALLALGMKMSLPQSQPYVFFQYCVLGIWVSLGVPYIITRMRTLGGKL